MLSHSVPYGFNVSVTIRREGGEAFVDVHAPMYQRKQWTMPHSYEARSFSDTDIIKDHDFIRVMLDHFPPLKE